MDRLQKIILISLVSTSAVTWLVSGIEGDNMMAAMMFASDGTLNLATISLFTAIWTAGMAAMMFPAISPMVLLYNKIIDSSNQGATAAAMFRERTNTPSRHYSSRTILFVGSYLVVWALMGIVLLIGWTFILSNAAIATLSPQGSTQSRNIIYGIILIISGAYQFSPIKNKCLGYCESPLSFFMRRWKDGASGAARMGFFHGIYCLGCCWPYFLLMVALGWMNLLWMGLFAAIIFGEKIWKRGIWIARAAGVGLAIVGIYTILVIF